MPNRNGTGPEGKGPKTGRGLGACGNGIPRGDDQGRGRGRGLGLRRNSANMERESENKD